MDNKYTQTNSYYFGAPVRFWENYWEQASQKFLNKRITAGHLKVEWPSGRHQTFGSIDSPMRATLKLYSIRSLIRLFLDGQLGIAEGYIRGEWATTSLTDLMLLYSANQPSFSKLANANWLFAAANRFRHANKANTRVGSRRNIAFHYDLGNEFYQQWLDKDMTYSSALFNDLDETLSIAQRRKYMRLAKKLDLKPGDKVLEIGCGWGGFAEIAAAEFGCQLICITLSDEQAKYAQNRIERAGLGHKIEIRTEDYRDVAGKFDKIVSIEMFEAVGLENWKLYFERIHSNLKSDGVAALQVITIADNKFDSYKKNPEFIQRYIFPGGMLPSITQFETAVQKANLLIADRFFFGRSYAETLNRWNAAFQKRWPVIEGLGFDERFKRMWLYYLSYCQVGFSTNQIDV